MSATSTVTFSDFPVEEANKRNPVVGMVATDGKCYCRVCVDRLNKSWNGAKVITRRRSNTWDYNCYNCGYKISKDRVLK